MSLILTILHGRVIPTSKPQRLMLLTGMEYFYGFIKNGAEGGNRTHTPEGT